ncbi:MAG: NAD+ synthase [Gammaproteobacteria bacterium]|nr:NAD+ synthase [Gammaproteobacteria bacterium]
MSNVQIGLAQINTLVGDVEGNTRRVLDCIEELRLKGQGGEVRDEKQGRGSDPSSAGHEQQDANGKKPGAQRDEPKCDLIAFPELTLTGYPPEDLLLHPDMRRQVAAALERLRAEVYGTLVAVGHPEYSDGRIYNSCSVIGNGETRAVYRKRELPNYGVFDDKRYFSPGNEPVVLDVGGLPVGLSICEDAWVPEPIAETAAAGARLILNINASPYCLDKRIEREEVIGERARVNGVPVLYLNLVGGQDEVVFDGHSFLANKAGDVVERQPGFKESIAVYRFATMPGHRVRSKGLYVLQHHERKPQSQEPQNPELQALKQQQLKPQQGAGASDDSLPRKLIRAPAVQVAKREAEIYSALTLGVHDYVLKNGFKAALVGLSGGVDSALTLVIAADALGAQQVTAVLMPSRYTSELSQQLAREQVRRLGVKSHAISIEQPYQAFMSSLKSLFSGDTADVTEENIQARCRGVILMALSNKSRKLVLTTGNKSEYATGYATLYGDMAGGFAPLKDVSKTLVYQLARYRNRTGDEAPIPEQVLTREPSAELAADQKDTDKLPPYPVLDAVLEGLVENDLSAAALIEAGYEADTVQRIAELVKNSEYKRRQAPPGVKISRLAFGRERRYPISSGFVLDPPAQAAQPVTRIRTNGRRRKG